MKICLLAAAIILAMFHASSQAETQTGDADPQDVCFYYLRADYTKSEAQTELNKERIQLKLKPSTVSIQCGDDVIGWD